MCPPRHRRRTALRHARPPQNRTTLKTRQRLPDLACELLLGDQTLGLLVQVSSARRRASTPCLSTPSSPGGLSQSLLEGNLISGPASRLDAFSAYRIRSRPPGRAAGATTGAPWERPSWSSRTRDSTPQVSNARNR